MRIDSIDQFVAYFDRIRERTRRVAACIPANHIEWTPREGAFTLGDIVRHVAAMERYMFAENVVGRLSTYPGHGRDLADGLDAVMAYLDRLHAESVECFAQLGAEDLRRKIETPAGAAMPAWKWLRAMVEHEVHHRGQLYVMLGMLGVETPPLCGLTSEEVRARSRSGDGP